MEEIGARFIFSKGKNLLLDLKQAIKEAASTPLGLEIFMSRPNIPILNFSFQERST